MVHPSPYLQKNQRGGSDILRLLTSFSPRPRPRNCEIDHGHAAVQLIFWEGQRPPLFLWKDRAFEQLSKNLSAFRLPLRRAAGERAGGEVVLQGSGAKLNFPGIRKG